MGMISLICNIVDHLKKGGSLLDNKQSFDYPNITEESYAIESILLDNHVFDYIVNNYKIDIDKNKIIILLKKALVSFTFLDNKKFLTPHFRNKFPIFIKNINNDYVSEEELNEIKNNKKELFK